MYKEYYSTKGRIGTTAFITRWISSFILAVIAYVVLLDSPNASLVAGMVILLCSINVVIQSIKRMHDLNKRGWYVVLPVYNIILLLAPGDTVKNSYGIPDENSNANDLERIVMSIFSGCIVLAFFTITSITKESTVGNLVFLIATATTYFTTPLLDKSNDQAIS